MNRSEGTDAVPQRVIAGTESVRLVCDFDYRDDRYGHRIGILAPDDRCTYLLNSIERGDDEAWPSSPPVQDLSIETIDDCPTALAVGMAGRSHWSISIQAVRSEAGEIEFDYACKVQPGPASLGNTYQLEAGNWDASRQSLHSDAGAIRLIPVKGVQLATLPPGRFALTVAESGDITTSRTIVWTYRIALIS